MAKTITITRKDNGNTLTIDAGREVLRSKNQHGPLFPYQVIKAGELEDGDELHFGTGMYTFSTTRVYKRIVRTPKKYRSGYNAVTEYTVDGRTYIVGCDRMKVGEKWVDANLTNIRKAFPNVEVVTLSSITNKF